MRHRYARKAMSAGTASRARFQSLPEVARFISGMPSTDAIALGRLRGDLEGALHLTHRMEIWPDLLGGVPLMRPVGSDRY